MVRVTNWQRTSLCHRSKTCLEMYISREASMITTSSNVWTIYYRSLKSTILLVPWSSIASWAFLASGLVIYSLNASKVSEKTQTILDITESNVNAYNRHLETIISTSIISIILGIVGIFVGVLAAWIHVKDVLEGLRWGSATRFVLNGLLTIGLLYSFACIAWYDFLIELISWILFNCIFKKMQVLCHCQLSL